MSLPTDSEVDELFATFDYTAFRLHVRDRYDVPRETESIQKFLAGEPKDLDKELWFKPWMDMIREITAQGKRVERVRVVTVPLTDHSRYGLWSARFNNEAGEDIRYLDRDHAGGFPSHDYWLVKRNVDDVDDHFVSAEIIDDPAEVVRHNYWRDLAWHRAVRREDFAIE